MSTLPNKEIMEFVNLCNRVYEAWRTHRVLFDDNPRKTELQHSEVNNALDRLSVITQEYSLQQISKLHDPAVDKFGNRNLGIDYIVKYGGWDTITLKKLSDLKVELEILSNKIRPARNKLLSHNDLRTITGPVKSLGSFPQDADIDYFNTLQEFVNIVNEKVFGTPVPFSKVVDADNKALLASIKL